MNIEGVQGKAVFENIRSLRYENVTINGVRQKDHTEDIGVQKAVEAV